MRFLRVLREEGKLLDEAEGAVVVLALAEASVDETDEFYGGTEREAAIGFAIDVVGEYVAQTFLLHVETRDERVVATQRCLVLQVHASHNGIYALLVQTSEAHAERREIEVACVLGVVEIVGIVDDALDVALIVANLHFGLENVFRLHNTRFINIQNSIFKIGVGNNSTLNNSKFNIE